MEIKRPAHTWTLISLGCLGDHSGTRQWSALRFYHVTSTWDLHLLLWACTLRFKRLRWQVVLNKNSIISIINSDSWDRFCEDLLRGSCIGSRGLLKLKYACDPSLNRFLPSYWCSHGYSVLSQTLTSTGNMASQRKIKRSGNVTKSW